MTRPGITKLPCGCTHDADRWLSECSTHKAEQDALHARALAEHRELRRTSQSAPASPALDWLDIPDQVATPCETP